ncbi:MAG: hypothetical protein CMO47_11320 [Verrucomicrobiales bacterium]|nr:hypothetical protein [Verrucomicrobiales bacterium]
MQSRFTFELDGEDCRVERENTHRTLAGFLSELDPCFAHFANDASWRGGHLVVLGDLKGDRHRFRAVDAQLLMLPMLSGRQVWTPEGIRNAEPDHPVNLALHNGHLECGRARGDAVVALMFEGYYRLDLRRHVQSNDQFDAIITRSANIPAIREVAAQVFASAAQLRNEYGNKVTESDEESTERLENKDIFEDRFTKSLFDLKSRAFLSYVDDSKRRFHQPSNLVELLKLKREYPDAQFIAGGTELAQQSGKVGWSNLISLEDVKELTGITIAKDFWDIGAAVPLTEIAEKLGSECEAFNKVICRFGSRAIRNRASLGGYLATAWESGQLTPLLMALQARVILLSEEGERDAPISNFYKDGGGTILNPNEVIRSIIIPRYNESSLSERGVTARLCNTYTAAPRRTLCEPYATGGFAVELCGRKVSKAWIAYSGINQHPVRAREAERFLAGKRWGEKTVFEMLPILVDTVKVTDHRNEIAGSDYRKQLVVTLFQKFLFHHPTPESIRPESLTAAVDFAKLNQPFFDEIAD